jgi:4-alpha-glucanotransferase
LAPALGPGSTGWPTPAKAGGNYCRSARQDTATRPYQALSTFAGNELLVSPDDLIEDGLLRPEDCIGSSFSTTAVDYATVIPFKRRLLEIAWGNFAAAKRADLRHAFGEFCEREAHWLDEYALFRALKTRFGGTSYLGWPADLVRRERPRRRHASKKGNELPPLNLTELHLTTGIQDCISW